MEGILQAIITPVLTGLIVWAIERSKAKRDELKEEAEEVNSDVNYATMELAYATAMAVKRGQANGEVEAAIEEYDKAKKKRDAFNEKVAKRMMK